MKRNSKSVLDELVNNAIYLCKKGDYDRVSPYLFQRQLMIDLDTAIRLFEELKKIKLVTNVEYTNEEGDENWIGYIDKEKLKELIVN